MFGLSKKTDSFMIIEGDEIVIKTRYRLSGRPAGEDKRFHMSEIKAVNFGKPTVKYMGYIQLVVDGWDETTGETSVFFGNNTELASANLYKAIDKSVKEYHEK